MQLMETRLGPSHWSITLLAEILPNMADSAPGGIIKHLTQCMSS